MKFALRSLFLTASLLPCLSPWQNAQARDQQGTPATYVNPVLFADYSDPDVIRDGNDFYLIASTFHFVPGIPILHSRDLVHWEIVGHVVSRLNMSPKYNLEGGDEYGGGVWAPAVRFHNGLFYVYFPTPGEGIFVSTAPHMTGPWTEPVAVISEAGLEDPCPFWDDDGKAYLVHSRKGAGPLILHRMAPDGRSVLDAGKVIVRDPEHLPTLEGPKLYKRHGWYYIFAPMGGVGEGAQAVLRSRDIEGPYDYRIVLARGDTAINGPHQGGYVETPDGRGWFLHFQLVGAHGRIVHLEPVRWEDDWPVMGEPSADKGVRQPVLHGPLPLQLDGVSGTRPQTSDEFAHATLSPMWEWNHNPDDSRWSLKARPGFLRLTPGISPDLLHARNTLTMMPQDENFEFTTRLQLNHLTDGDRVGLSLFDKTQTYIAVQRQGGKAQLVFMAQATATAGPFLFGDSVELRVTMTGASALYAYSLDNGRSFLPLGTPQVATFSWWKGARPAVFAFNRERSADTGYLDIDWARYVPVQEHSASQ